MSFVAASARSSAFGLLARPMRNRSGVVASQMAMRSYSDKAAAEKDAEADATSATDGPASEGNDVTKQLQEKDDRIKKLSDQVLYVKAELQNSQRRAVEEKTNASQFAISKLANDLTSSLDILDMALSSVPEPLRKRNKEDPNSTDAHRALSELYDGVDLTRKSLLDMLSGYGIVRFNPVGETFDPKLHEALYQAPVPGKEPGTVLECSKVGYMIKDRLLRAAQVGVVQES